MKRKKAVASVSIGFALVTGLAACSTSANGTQDAPVAHPKGSIKNILPNQGVIGQNNEKTSVINFPDGFENVGFKCNGVDGIYASTRDAAPVVVPNDPQCKG